MKIWILDSDVENFENLTWAKNINIDEVQSFDGRKKSIGWTPVNVKRMYNRTYSNTPGLTSHIPVFDSKAIKILKDLIIEGAEILPLNCHDGDFFAINVTDIINCIDYQNSEYKTFRDGKRIMRFTKYMFIESCIRNKHIFKIIDEPLRRPFVSDEFRNRVIDNKLTGFLFEKAWDSEE